MARHVNCADCVELLELAQLPWSQGPHSAAAAALYPPWFGQATVDALLDVRVGPKRDIMLPLDCVREIMAVPDRSWVAVGGRGVGGDDPTFAPR